MSSPAQPDPLDLPPQEDARFPILKAKADAHWSRYLPKLYADLKKNGTLDAALTSATERTILALNQCEDAGMSPDQAREVAYPNILLPNEESENDT